MLASAPDLWMFPVPGQGKPWMISGMEAKDGDGEAKRVEMKTHVEEAGEGKKNSTICGGGVSGSFTRITRNGEWRGELTISREGFLVWPSTHDSYRQPDNSGIFPTSNHSFFS